MFKIKKDVPIVESVTNGGRIEWPFRDMEVGDCVQIDDPAIMNKAQMRCHVWARVNQRAFKTKTIAGVLHIWRIK
jgi:hypothetical protein